LTCDAVTLPYRTVLAHQPYDLNRSVNLVRTGRLLIRAKTDANNAQSLAAAIRAGDAELTGAVKIVIDAARLRQDRDREASPPSTRPH
jgi:DNA-binding IclR family transcriptional regulator